MVEYVNFTANCLQGESHPCCLLQLLKFITSTQVVLAPFLPRHQQHLKLSVPLKRQLLRIIQSNSLLPPMIRIVLLVSTTQRSLLRIAFCEGRSTSCHVEISTHFLRSADLFLESLLPSPEDDNPGPLDKLEAVECLSTLLFPEPKSRYVDHMKHTLQSVYCKT